MSELIEGKNYGVIVVEPNPGDYVVGADSPVDIEIINPSGNNIPYAPDEENQSGNGDKMDCVTVSSAGSMETIFRILIALNKLPQNTRAWLLKWNFFDKDGNVRISTRWAAIQNGTTKEGNSANTVAEWWRKNGFIPEWMLPNDQTLNWNQFYNTAVITDEMRKCAKESLDVFSIYYKWILKDSDYKSSLQQGAVQVLTPVCPGWSTKSPIPTCNLDVAHATELLNVQGDGKKDIWDSYDPHHKIFASDYPVPYRMLYIVKPKIQNNQNIMTFKQIKGQNNIYACNDVSKIKSLVNDMPTLQGLYELTGEKSFTVVDNLNGYTDCSMKSFLGLDRIIN